jgi:hypothetical protein
MPNRPSRIVIGIPTASFDGKFYGRYPHGDKPSTGAVLQADAQSRATVNAPLTTGIRLLATAADAAAAQGGLSTSIRPAANAIDVVNAAGALTTQIRLAAAAAAQAAATASFIAVQDVTTFGVEGAGTEFVSFAQPFAQGDVPAGTIPVITTTGNAPITSSSAVVLAAHPDGSARHAILSAQLTGGTSYKIRTGSQSGTSKTIADFLAVVAGDIARIDTTGGIVATSVLRDLLTNPANRAPGGLVTRASTPQYLEGVVGQNISTHVRVDFHFRWFGGSVYWVDVIRRNGYGDLNGQGDVTYSTTITIAGSVIYGPTSTTHYNHAMHGVAGWSTGGTLYVHHNVAYLKDNARIFPNFVSSTAPSNTFLNTLPTTPPAAFTRGTFWQIPDDINDTGYGDMIGPKTRGDALYVVANGDKRAFLAMRNFHDCMSGYPVFFMSSIDGDHIRVSDYPNTDINNHAGFGTGAFTSSNPLGFVRTSSTVSHAPSPATSAYALTADMRYLFQMTAWGSAGALWATAGSQAIGGYNRTKNGMTVRLCYPGEVRGLAWFYRNIGELAYLLPDSHVSKAYYTNTLLNQFDNDIGIYITSTPLSGLGALQQTYDWFDPASTVYAPWEHSFYAWALHHVCVDLGFSYGMSLATFSGKFIAGIHNATREHPFEFAAGYTVKIGPSTGTFYSTFAQYAADTFNVPTAAQSIETGTQSMANYINTNQASIPQALNYTGARYETRGDQAGATYYFANMIAGVAALEELQVQGGSRCWDLLQLSGKWPDFSQIPQFGVAKRDPVLPAWRPAAGTIAAISLNHITDAGIDPETTNPPNQNFPTQANWCGTLHVTAITNAWCGAAYARNLSKLGHIIAIGGGHLGYFGNEFYGFDLDTLKWSRLIDPYNPVPFPSSIDQTEGEMATGIPASNHTQNWPTWLASSPLDNTADKGIYFQAGSTSNHDVGGGGTGRSHYCPLNTPRAWGRYSTNRATNNSAGAYSSACSVYDPLRERIWLIAGSQSFPNVTNLQYMDRGVRTWTQASPTIEMPYTDNYVAAMYVPKKDWIVVVNYPFGTTTPQIFTIDLSNLAGGIVSRSFSGTPPAGGGAPFAWIPELGKFASMDPTAGTRTIIYLTPPASISGSWVFSSETLSGATPQTSVNQLFTKMQWASRTKCLVLVTHVNDSVYALRPSGV